MQRQAHKQPVHGQTASLVLHILMALFVLLLLVGSWASTCAPGSYWKVISVVVAVIAVALAVPPFWCAARHGDEQPLTIGGAAATIFLAAVALQAVFQPERGGEAILLGLSVVMLPLLGVVFGTYVRSRAKQRRRTHPRFSYVDKDQKEGE